MQLTHDSLSALRPTSAHAPGTCLFWLWFVPMIVAGTIAGFALHPILIGVVLAVAGNAVLVRRNFKKADWLNEPLLEES